MHRGIAAIVTTVALLRPMLLGGMPALPSGGTSSAGVCVGGDCVLCSSPWTAMQRALD